MPPDKITSFKQDGVLIICVAKISSPKIYSKWVFSVPSSLLPTNGNVIVSNELQSLNAANPIQVTLLGIVIFFNELHHSNAFSPILVTPSGTNIPIKLTQS